MENNTPIRVKNAEEVVKCFRTILSTPWIDFTESTKSELSATWNQAKDRLASVRKEYGISTNFMGGGARKTRRGRRKGRATRRR